MKIRTKLIIGFVILSSFFGVALTVDVMLNEQIHRVADYHNFMSVPALTNLEQIEISFLSMHNQIVESLVLAPDMKNDATYQNNYEKLNDGIQKYDDLTWSQRENGQYFAPPMMREQMQEFVTQMEESRDAHNQKVQTIFLEDPNNMQIQQTIEELNTYKNDFLQTVEQAIIMETNGMNREQAKIDSVTKEFEMIRNVIITVGVISTAGISYFIIQGVSKPINQFRNVANHIARGNYSERLDEKGSEEYKQLSEDINKMSEQLEHNTNELKKQERLSAIGELSARIAHDVRNPLAAIKVTSELLEAELPRDIKEKQSERFRVIDRSISRIAHQVEDVLDYVRERELKLTSCNVADIVKQSFADVTIPKNVKVNFELSNSNIICDKEKIETVVTNLLINAVQALTGEGQITIKTKVEDNVVIITVEDSGPGVPAHIKDEIFEPLFTTKQTGTGLGLASCKKIVEAHKGTITYSNNPSTFTVELPQITNPLLKEKI